MKKLPSKESVAKKDKLVYYYYSFPFDLLMRQKRIQIRVNKQALSILKREFENEVIIKEIDHPDEKTYIIFINPFQEPSLARAMVDYWAKVEGYECSKICTFNEFEKIIKKDLEKNKSDSKSAICRENVGK